MILLDEVKRDIGELAPEVEKLGVALNINALKRELQELEERSARPEFYEDTDQSTVVFSKMSHVRDKLEAFANMQEKLDDAETLLELWEEGDEDAAEETAAVTEKLAQQVEKIRLLTLLTGEFDDHNAILMVHAGAGGTEAQDWAQILLRMYTRYANSHGFTTTILDFLDGDEAGLKSATVLIEGENAYGFLKSEHGVHRLVRISPFDSSGRRHTSFASVEVTPEIKEDTAVHIDPEDIRVDVYRASGAGGQHVNKTSSAVRMTHLPTNIVVTCQSQRSQLQNRETAMKMLVSRLVQIKEQEHLERIEDIKGDQKDIAWGHQIRSYVFMPYTLVKDHRTNYEDGNVEAVIDGDLDGFINAYLTAASRGELSGAAENPSHN